MDYRISRGGVHVGRVMASVAALTRGAQYVSPRPQGYEGFNAFDMHGDSTASVMASRIIGNYELARRDNEAAARIREVLAPDQIAQAIEEVKQLNRCQWLWIREERGYAAVVDGRIISVHQDSYPAQRAALAAVGLTTDQVTV